MKKIILLLSLIISSIATWYACLPYFPHNMTIAKYLWSYSGNIDSFQNQKNKEVLFLSLSHIKKPLPRFWQYIPNSHDKHFITQTNISLSWYNPWDIVMFIDDYGWYPPLYDPVHEYHITEIAKIIQSWDILQLENKQWTIKDRDKPMRRCGNNKWEDVLTEEKLLEYIKPGVSNIIEDQNIFRKIKDKIMIRILNHK